MFFCNSLAFTVIQQMLLAIWSLVPLPFLNPAWISGSSQFMYCWSLAWRILSITLLACGMSAVFQRFEHSLHCLSLGLEWKLTFSSPVATAEWPSLLSCWVQHFNSGWGKLGLEEGLPCCGEADHPGIKVWGPGQSRCLIKGCWKIFE